MTFTDEYERLLPIGTTVLLSPYSPHVGRIGYTRWGQQVIGHNSKQHRRVVITLPEGFNDGHIPVRYVYPRSIEDGQRIWQNVMNEAQRGVLWAWFNNCQDFNQRVDTGQNGSPTRDAILGGAAVVGGLVWLGRASSKPNHRRRRSRR